MIIRVYDVAVAQLVGDADQLPDDHQILFLQQDQIVVLQQIHEYSPCFGVVYEGWVFFLTDLVHLQVGGDVMQGCANYLFSQLLLRVGQAFLNQQQFVYEFAYEVDCLLELVIPYALSEQIQIVLGLLHCCDCDLELNRLFNHFLYLGVRFMLALGYAIHDNIPPIIVKVLHFKILLMVVDTKRICLVMEKLASSGSEIVLDGLISKLFVNLFSSFLH